MAHENCNTCGVDYDYTIQTSRLFCFLTDGRANHILATCPNGHGERVFINASNFIQALETYKLHVSFAIAPSEDLLDAALRAWREANKQQEVEPPVWMLRELYDDLRNFGNQEEP